MRDHFKEIKKDTWHWLSCSISRCTCVCECTCICVCTIYIQKSNAIFALTCPFSVLLVERENHIFHVLCNAWIAYILWNELILWLANILPPGDYHFIGKNTWWPLSLFMRLKYMNIIYCLFSTIETYCDFYFFQFSNL